MPWKLVHNHPACRAGEWAVVNERAEAEGRHSIEGCHATRDEALAQQRALYAKEPQMSLRQLTVSIEQKDVTDVGSGEITGLAAVYGNVDLQDDMVEAGAANKTVSDWSRAKQRVPLLDWHGDSISRIIGSVTEMKSVSQGVWFRAGFTKDEQGQRARQLAKDGFLTGVSIGYLPIRQSMKMIGDRMVRVLHEIRIHEVSLTPVPANPEAQLASVKSLDGDDKATAPYGDVAYADPGYQDDGQKRYPLDTEAHCRAAWSYINQADNAAKYSAAELTRIKGRIKAALARYGVQVNASLDFPAFAELARKALEIGHDVAAKAAFDALLSDYTSMAAGSADEPSTADTAVITGEEPAGDTVAPSDDPAAYALRIITPPGPRDGAPDGEPPKALAGPLGPLEIARQNAQADRLEAEINHALGGLAV